MGLREYRRKRNFRVTSEPRAGRGKRGGAGTARYVIQKHDATRLHYDFRLEMEGVLKSWAVPKGPSTDPSERVLAVEVEDHPLEYGGFEGTIPKGQYGGGTVMLWDRGTWEMQEAGSSPIAAWKKGKLKFVLHGEKLHGGWTLVRMKGTKDGKKNWLLIKERDEDAGGPDARVEQTRSVTTGREMHEIAGDVNGKTWNSKPAKKAAKSSRPAGKRPKAGVDASGLKGAVKAAQPAFIPPQLATLSEEAPEGGEWYHEIKFDGYRMLAILEPGGTRLLTRNNKDWTDRFKELAGELGTLGGPGILDGEVVSLDEAGVSSFQSLQRLVKEGRTGLAKYFAFDVLHWGGVDVTGCVLRDRRALLKQILQGAGGRIVLSEHIEQHGAEVLVQACRIGLEGIVSKDAESRYEPGARTRTWLKIKCWREQEFVIGGYTAPKRTRVGFGSLLLGYYEGGELRYAGNVGTGFDTDLLGSLRARLEKLRIDEPAFATPQDPGPEYRKATWVRPELVGAVAFTEWTMDGRLRHPVFRGLREDKDAAEVRRERAGMATPRGAVSKARGKAAAAPKASGEDAEVLGVRISHPGREVYPGAGITKLDVARYYERIAAYMMPHVEGRALSVVRCGQGQGGECFYQKHMKVKGLAGLGSTTIKEKSGKAEYIVVEAPEGLISLVQMNALELHVWGSSAEDIERPDRLVFDLDPGENVTWDMLVEGAERVKAILEEIGLASFVKTTGGKGLHVVSPIRRRGAWDAVKELCHEVALRLATEEPERYVATMSKAQRTGKIFVDYLRNGRGATSVAVLSTRAREGGTVSMPRTWGKIRTTAPKDFSLGDVDAIVKALKPDPWRGFGALRQG